MISGLGSFIVTRGLRSPLRLPHCLLAAVLFHFIDVKIRSEWLVHSARKDIFAADLFTVQALIGIVIRAERSALQRKTAEDSS
jgi:hypothetical protein